MPPSRPSKDEINFTRLLRACEQLASEAAEREGHLLNSTQYAPFKQVRCTGSALGMCIYILIMTELVC